MSKFKIIFAIEIINDRIQNTLNKWQHIICLINIAVYDNSTREKVRKSCPAQPNTSTAVRSQPALWIMCSASPTPTQDASLLRRTGV